jgi:hypothetical protein
MVALNIPDELIEQANRIPGLGDRLIRFIKLEVAQFELRQKRFQPETLALVARAKAKADEKRTSVTGLEAERIALLRQLDEMTTHDTL